MPIDLSTLAILASLFFGAVVGDAVLFGDPLQVQITVPSKLTDSGFDEAAAERVFASEVARSGRAESIVKTPDVQMSSSTSVFAALAKPLHLEDVVVALQQQVGIGVVSVRGAVVDAPAGGGLEIVIFITQPNEAPTQVRLTQADGDAVRLVERGARQVMEQISPYRVALTDFATGIRGDAAALASAETVANRALTRGWAPNRATQQVMLHNLLGVKAAFEGQLEAAEAQFALSDAIPQALPAAHGVVACNRAFLAVAQRQPALAVATFKAALELSATVELNGYQDRLALLGGLVAWSAGNLAAAEAWLRKASAGLPYDDAPHAYLASLLEAKGDLAGAAAERKIAADRADLDLGVPSLILSEFWVDPVHGGLKRRN